MTRLVGTCFTTIFGIPYPPCPAGEGPQGDQEKEDIVVVLQHGFVCISTLQEQEECCFISVSSNSQRQYTGS